MYLAVAFVCYVNGSCIFINSQNTFETLDDCVSSNTEIESVGELNKEINLIRTDCFMTSKDS